MITYQVRILFYYYWFWSHCSLEIAALKTGNKDYLKTITASSFKLSQLIVDDFFFSYCRLQI